MPPEYQKPAGSEQEQLAYLLGVIDRLKRVIESHLDRDVDVSQIVSGSEPVWLCARELDDLREASREGVIAQEAWLDSERERVTLEHRVEILTGEIEVSPDEQLEVFRAWLRSKDD